MGGLRLSPPPVLAPRPVPPRGGIPGKRRSTGEPPSTVRLDGVVDRPHLSPRGLRESVGPRQSLERPLPSCDVRPARAAGASGAAPGPPRLGPPAARGAAPLPRLRVVRADPSGSVGPLAPGARRGVLPRRQRPGNVPLWRGAMASIRGGLFRLLQDDLLALTARRSRPDRVVQ